MKINVKIIRTILTISGLIFSTFIYLLLSIYYQAQYVSNENKKYNQLSLLSQKLSDEQAITDYNLLKYFLSQNQSTLSAISLSDINKNKAIDMAYPYVSETELKSQLANYLQTKTSSDIARVALINSIDSGNRRLMNQAYENWFIESKKIEERIIEIRETNRLYLVANSQYYQDILNKFLYTAALILVIFFVSVIYSYNYLKKNLSGPIGELSEKLADFSKNNFQNPIIVKKISGDEIGILQKNFNQMSIRISDGYEALEKMVSERTSALSEKTSFNESVISSIGDALVVVNKDGLITNINNAFKEITGYKKAEVLGKKMIDILLAFNEEDRQFLPEERSISKILNGEIVSCPPGETIYYQKKDGTRFPIRSLTNKIVLEGKIVGAVKTFADITIEKQVDSAKNEFVGLAAHQLRTPLATIGWYSEFLETENVENLNENQKKYIEQIRTSNERMVQMVKSFLNASRIDLGTFTPDKKEANISELVSAEIAEQKPSLESKDIKVHLDSELESSKIQVDPGQMRMVFQNILSNSIKYSNPGGEIFVTLYKDPNKNTLNIKFRDFGIGIPEGAKDRIFSKMFRADNVKDIGIDGTGLGLYIAKKTVEQSGGKIWFESKVGVGTCFYISLPIC